MQGARALEVFDWMAESYWDLSLDLLCIAGFDGIFRRVNPAWELTLGWTEAELTARPFVSFVHPDDRERTRNETSRLVQGELTLSFENRYQHRDGTYRNLEWRARASVAHGVIFASARDVTDARRAERLEERLAQAERLAALGTLAAGVGHEINNPMVGVITNVTFAEDATRAALAQLAAGDSAEATRILQATLDALGDAAFGADRVHRIVHDLRRFARTEVMVSKLIDVRAAIEAAIEHTTSQVRGTAQIVRDLRPTPSVLGNAEQLTEIVSSLVLNAAQALTDSENPHAEIRIETSTDPAGSAVIVVRDTGPGIAPEILPRIFDPFFTTKSFGEGMGLGLAVVHQLVGMFGGEITVDSTVGRGARFQVTLPAARVPPKTQTIRMPTLVPSRRGQILLIDDEEVVVRSLKRILGRGHDVHVANDGATALAMITTTDYDMILCDLMMPGMSGVDLYERVASTKPGQAARMVFMTGGAFTPRTSEFLETTGNRMLLKPFTADTLRGVAADMIEGR